MYTYTHPGPLLKLDNIANLMSVLKGGTLEKADVGVHGLILN